MRIYRSLAGLPSAFGPCALSIGNFDGVHVGHRRILRRVKEIASERGWKASVLTFDPHPTQVVAPGRTPPLLTEPRSEEHTSELQSLRHLVCRLLLEKKKSNCTCLG